MTVNLTDREVAFVLAALRHAQRDIRVVNLYPQMVMEHYKPLTSADVNRLCEKINMGGGR